MGIPAFFQFPICTRAYFSCKTKAGEIIPRPICYRSGKTLLSSMKQPSSALTFATSFRL